ncbi:hypothetical protein [Jiangella rhizosphaerae]|uniref:Uncharacterized protein n=1 Tax=Jiangella rhizosphaerae TaxID=2293569 RepID=A0A418KHC3_9ACTN|nr:hypothetical protein [Jiangella rhizosphaerae]RIQ11593.1 hypothetical protein DY240_28390 [Jiangella rhizosphaerae]
MTVVVVLLIALVVVLLLTVTVVYARQPVPGTGRVSRYRRRARAAPRFRLERLSQHRYVLHNDGGMPAHDVRLDTGDLTVTEGETHLREFGPRHAEHYLLIQPMYGRVSDLIVHWHLRPGDDAEQVTPLPLDIEAASEGQDA